MVAQITYDSKDYSCCQSGGVVMVDTKDPSFTAPKEYKNQTILCNGCLIKINTVGFSYQGHFYTVKDTSIKILSITILMGLSTYFVHGFLNNFLDTDKASVPFWGFLAMLVCIDVYFKDEQTEGEKLI